MTEVDLALTNVLHGAIGTLKKTAVGIELAKCK
jgi:hypothetical protein